MSLESTPIAKGATPSSPASSPSVLEFPQVIQSDVSPVDFAMSNNQVGLPAPPLASATLAGLSKTGLQRSSSTDILCEIPHEPSLHIILEKAEPFCKNVSTISENSSYTKDKNEKTLYPDSYQIGSAFLHSEISSNEMMRAEITSKDPLEAINLSVRTIPSDPVKTSYPLQTSSSDPPQESVSACISSAIKNEIFSENMDNKQDYQINARLHSSQHVESGDGTEFPKFSIASNQSESFANLGPFSRENKTNFVGDSYINEPEIYFEKTSNSCENAAKSLETTNISDILCTGMPSSNLTNATIQFDSSPSLLISSTSTENISSAVPSNSDLKYLSYPGVSPVAVDSTSHNLDNKGKKWSIRTYPDSIEIVCNPLVWRENWIEQHSEETDLSFQKILVLSRTDESIYEKLDCPPSSFESEMEVDAIIGIVNIKKYRFLLCVVESIDASTFSYNNINRNIFLIGRAICLPLSLSAKFVLEPSSFSIRMGANASMLDNSVPVNLSTAANSNDEAILSTACDSSSETKMESPIIAKQEKMNASTPMISSSFANTSLSSATKWLSQQFQVNSFSGFFGENSSVRNQLNRAAQTDNRIELNQRNASKLSAAISAPKSNVTASAASANSYTADLKGKDIATIGRIIANIEKALNTGFYYSYDIDITHTLQRKVLGNMSCLPQTPPSFEMNKEDCLVNVVDDRFWWNKWMCLPFLHSGVSEQWLVPIMQGYISFERFEKDRQFIETVLFCRKGCKRVGTRFNARGIDDEGNVANFAEIEQMVRLDLCEEWASLVQIRGSVPIFWEQQSVTSPTSFNRSSLFTTSAFRRHQEMLQYYYGDNINYLDLLNRTKSAESNLSRAFVEQMHLHEVENPDEKQLNLYQFDFHNEMKSKGYHEAVSDLVQRLLSDSIKSMDLRRNTSSIHMSYAWCWLNAYLAFYGYDCLHLPLEKRGTLQKNSLSIEGVASIEESRLTQQEVTTFLHNFSDVSIDVEASLPSTKPIEIKEELNETMDDTEDFRTSFNRMWAELGDTISFQYTGTGSLFSSQIKKGKLSMSTNFDHAWKSLNRFYQNNMMDSSRQECLDVLLGIHKMCIVSLPPPIQDEIEASDSNLVSKLEDLPINEERQHKYVFNMKKLTNDPLSVDPLRVDPLIKIPPASTSNTNSMEKYLQPEIGKLSTFFSSMPVNTFSQMHPDISSLSLNDAFLSFETKQERLFRNPSWEEKIDTPPTKRKVNKPLSRFNSYEWKSIKVEPIKPHRLRMWCGTWNLAGQDLYELDSLEEWLFTHPEQCDIYVFCFQELVELTGIRVLMNMKDKDKETLAEEKINAALHKAIPKYSKSTLGNTYGCSRFLKIQSCAMLGLYISVYIREGLKDFVSGVDVSSIKVGLKGNRGNKGAVCVRFLVGRSSFCFINVHLAAGENSLQERIQQMQQIMKQAYQTSRYYIEPLDHDYVILIGDFNFRVEKYLSEVLDAIQRKNYLELSSFDQLRHCIRQGLSPFRGFLEGKIDFPPTYKYRKNASVYDSQRVPAWCDRILYFVGDCSTKTEISQRPAATLLHYISHQTYQCSDHKPVSASLEMVALLPDRNISLKRKQKEKTLESISLVEESPFLTPSGAFGHSPNFFHSVNNDAQQMPLEKIDLGISRK
ncbi:endonuclease/exonuclease/phosphatase domain-containing protein [Cardiosporidium cionae]|uniref:phosphoinositide 5-phosphatase n=1 Tax=Cardiosporidium cionae TaxID=476202 RepID=A0ABQ7JA44_9APIC|nr:endonuclease/exonuclease/phosphatase domain-containing protein [Cardiosporidium cionae]|eukprot:KAF8820867.1 endonuclease/exonuclease/phosphatase domain-containing protein [Cardiosporidium cionae]